MLLMNGQPGTSCEGEKPDDQHRDSRRRQQEQPRSTTNTVAKW